MWNNSSDDTISPQSHWFLFLFTCAVEICSLSSVAFIRVIQYVKKREWNMISRLKSLSGCVAWFSMCSSESLPPMTSSNLIKQKNVSLIDLFTFRIEFYNSTCWILGKSLVLNSVKNRLQKSDWDCSEHSPICCTINDPIRMKWKWCRLFSDNWQIFRKRS